LLKDIYFTVMEKGQTKGASFNSKPYRLRIQNGCYITMETEWTSFVNPWTRQLEFVIGHHHVLKGPSNKDIFGSCVDFKDRQHQDDAVKDTDEIKNEILKMFSKIMTRPLATVKQQVSKRCKELATFMETLMNDVTCPNLKLFLPAESEIAISERGSVVLCEISPHHDYDGKTSSSTPPSYNQLNYYENLQRFFDSRPVTTAQDDLKLEQTHDSPGSRVQQVENRSTLSPVSFENVGVGSSRSGSGEHYSSASNMRMDSVTSHSSTYSSKAPKLTKDLISKHNDEMEKIMCKKYLESRMQRNANQYYRKANLYIQNAHGVKRSGSHSWKNNDVHKTSKQHYRSEVHNETNPPRPLRSQLITNTATHPPDLWPPFAASLTTLQNKQPGLPLTATASSLLAPIYYIPSRQPNNISSQESSVESPIKYLPNGIMAYPMYGGQHIVYPSPTIMYRTLPYLPEIPSAIGKKPRKSSFDVSS
jgi:period circadian protein 2